MSRFNVSTNHPIIPNSNEYMYEKQLVSIHSEDRNSLKYPNSAEFEIELPQDYCNVQSVRLSSWTFPSNYNTFSALQNNIQIAFQITNPYNPSDYMISDPLLIIISDALQSFVGQSFTSTISEGFYNPFQIAIELTNRFNNTVSLMIEQYILSNSTQDLLNQFNLSGGYDQFVIVYNEVGQKLWFGNKSSDFIISNDSVIYMNSVIKGAICNNHQYNDYNNWGLPSYLGFTRDIATTIPIINDSTVATATYPRFFYGDVKPGDNGFWLLPDSRYVGSNTSIPVYYLETPFKINLMGNSYFYMEIAGMNNIDETLPFSVNNFTSTTNSTASVVKSSFAKIGITTTPIAQWFDDESPSFKVYNPPAERINKLKFKLRYHNGALVDFGNFNYSVSLEFMLLRPQSKRNYSIFSPQVISSSTFGKC